MEHESTPEEPGLPAMAGARWFIFASFTRLFAPWHILPAMETKSEDMIGAGDAEPPSSPKAP